MSQSISKSSSVSVKKKFFRRLLRQKKFFSFWRRTGYQGQNAIVLEVHDDYVIYTDERHRFKLLVYEMIHEAWQVEEFEDLYMERAYASAVRKWKKSADSKRIEMKRRGENVLLGLKYALRNARENQVREIAHIKKHFDKQLDRLRRLSEIETEEIEVLCIHIQTLLSEVATKQ